MGTAGASEATSTAAASVGTALVRPPSDAFARALSSRRATIDPLRARAQHAAYRAALADLVRVVVLEQPALHGVRHKVVVPPREAAACNVVAVGTTAVLPAGCPQTAAAVRALGFEVREVDLGEFHKADGGATCLSLLV